jgi:dihydroxyacetone kinase
MALGLSTPATAPIDHTAMAEHGDIPAMELTTLDGGGGGSRSHGFFGWLSFGSLRALLQENVFQKPCIKSTLCLVSKTAASRVTGRLSFYER